MGNEIKKEKNISLKALKKNSYLKYLDEKTKISKMYSLPYHIGFKHEDAGNFDDYFKVLQNIKNERAYKVCKVVIFKRNYVCGIQFTYETMDQPYIKFEGHKMLHENIYSDYTVSSESLELQRDEFIIGIIARSGMNIDQLGFKTSKDREIIVGGEGGSEKIINIPQNKHLVEFGSQLGEHMNYLQFKLENIKYEAQIVPDTNQISYIPFSVFREVQKYLSIQDISTLFSLNRQMASYRLDPIILLDLSQRIILGQKENEAKYLKKLLKLQGINESFLNQDEEQYNYYQYKLIKRLIEQNKNIIEDPDGDKNLLGWTLDCDGGSGLNYGISDPTKRSCFKTSYGWCGLTFKKKFGEVFNQEFIDKLNKNKAVILCGANIIRTVDAEADLQLKLYDSNHNLLVSIQKEIYNELQQTYKLFSINFKNKNLLEFNQDCVLSFSFKGKDRVFWAGHYGPIFQGVFLKGYTQHEDLDNIFEYLPFDDAKLTQQSE